MSLSVCNHILGLLGAQDVVKSLRVVGVAQKAFWRKKKRIQKPPMVEDLERFVAPPKTRWILSSVTSVCFHAWAIQ